MIIVKSDSSDQTSDTIVGSPWALNQTSRVLTSGGGGGGGTFGDTGNTGPVSTPGGTFVQYTEEDVTSITGTAGAMTIGNFTGNGGVTGLFDGTAQSGTNLPPRSAIVVISSTNNNNGLRSNRYSAEQLADLFDIASDDEYDTAGLTDSSGNRITLRFGSATTGDVWHLIGVTVRTGVGGFDSHGLAIVQNQNTGSTVNNANPANNSGVFYDTYMGPIINPLGSWVFQNTGTNPGAGMFVAAGTSVTLDFVADGGSYAGNQLINLNAGDEIFFIPSNTGAPTRDASITATSVTRPTTDDLQLRMTLNATLSFNANETYRIEIRNRGFTIPGSGGSSVAVALTPDGLTSFNRQLNQIAEGAVPVVI